MIKFKEKITTNLTNFFKNKKIKEIDNVEKPIFEEKKNENHKDYLFGLKNLGNTCFFNSVLQCINSTIEFTKIYTDIKILDFPNENFEIIEEKKNKNDDGWQVVSKKNKAKGNKNKGKSSKNKEKQKEKEKIESDININKRFQDFLLETRRLKNKIADPSYLFKGISGMFARFRGYHQQDAQELLRFLLDALNIGEEKILKKEKSKLKITNIEQIFGGYLCNYLKCLNEKCGYVSRTFDFFLDLAVNIPEKNEPEQIKIHHPKKKGKKKKNNKNQKQLKITESEDEIEEKHEEKKENEQDIIINSDPKLNNNNIIENNLEATEKIPKISEINNLNPNKINYKYIETSQLSDLDIPGLDKDYYTLFEPEIKENLNKIDYSNMTLESCIDNFFAFEKLNIKDNYFSCENCKKEERFQTEAFKKFYLYDPPKVLTILIKRFVQKRGGSFEKNDQFVKIPLEINLDKHTILKEKKTIDEELLNQEKNINYNLFAIIQHSGSISGGHYVAYAKHEDQWYLFDDSHFHQVSIETVLRCEAYVVFYRLKTNK